MSNKQEVVLKILQAVLSSYNKNLMYVSLQFKLQLNGPDRKKLLELMRKQSSAIKLAYKLLKNNNPLLVEGVWNRMRRRLVPLEVGGTSQ